MFDQIRCQLASLISPRASLHPGEVLPQVHVVSAPPAATVASSGGLPRKSLEEIGLRITPEIMASAIVRHQAQANARTGRMLPAPTGKRPVSTGKSGSTDDEPIDRKTGAPKPTPTPTAADTVDQICELLKFLKTKLPAGDTTGDDHKETAKAELRAGRNAKALTCITVALDKVHARINEIGQFAKLPPLGKMAASFNRQPAVAALLSPAQRASLTLSACGGTPTSARTAIPAVVVPTAKTRVLTIQAELKALDNEQRKAFSNERNTRHSILSRELKAEVKKLRS